MKLLLDGKALEIGNTAIALTFQANDITKPDSIQSNYSNTFALPDTPYNRLLLGFANLVNAVTDSPYKKLDVQVFSSGREVVPYGKGQLVEHVENERFDLQVLSGNRDLFAEIEGKSIRDLDLSAYNHQWTSAAVIASASHEYTNGYIYDIVNRGIENQNIESKWTYFLPSTFARIIWDAIFSEAGFSYEWPEMPEVFNSFIITPGQPFGYGEKFIKARSSKASRFPSVDIERNHSNASGAPLKEWIIFDDDSSDNSVYDGEQNNYNPTTGWYTADTYMYVNVTFQLRFDLRVVNGKVKAKVFLGINGDGALYNTEQFFGNGIFSQNYPNQVFTHTFERVLLSPGDTLQLYVEITDDSTIFDYEVKLYLDKPGTFMQVDVLEEFPPNGSVILADWLPDISQKDFLKAFKKLFDLTFQPDLHLDLIKIGGFSGLITGISSAIDLTSRVNMLSKPKHRYLYDSFAKVNHFKWKAESNESTPETYGNGSILVQNEHLEAEKTPIEMPFAATFHSSGIPFIPLFEAKEGTLPVEYERVTSQPRLMVLEKVLTTYNYLDEEGEILESSNLKPIGKFIEYLDFQSIIIPTYYSALSAMLIDSRMITLEMYLTEADIIELDFLRPVFLEQYGAYFYLNRVVQWQSSFKPCEVELVRL